MRKRAGHQMICREVLGNMERWKMSKKDLGRQNKLLINIKYERDTYFKIYFRY